MLGHLAQRRSRSALLAGLTPLVLAATLTGCGLRDDDSAGSAGGSDVTCDYEEDGTGSGADLPPADAAYDGEVAASLATSQGDIAVTLDADAAPCTVNSFTSLAEQGFFDDTPCHRLTTAAAGIEVLQCGDPTGTGGGGPGYRFADELTGEETYPAGTLAMANAGPDTNGSQFFMVYGDSQLGPAYTVFGQVDPESLGTVEDIGAEGVQGGGADGPPAAEVSIEGVSIG